MRSDKMLLLAAAMPDSFLSLFLIKKLFSYFHLLVPWLSSLVAALSSRGAHCLGWPGPSQHQVGASLLAPHPHCPENTHTHIDTHVSTSSTWTGLTKHRRLWFVHFFICLPVYCPFYHLNSFCQTFCGHRTSCNPRCTGFQSIYRISHRASFCCKQEQIIINSFRRLSNLISGHVTLTVLLHCLWQIRNGAIYDKFALCFRQYWTSNKW